MSFEYMGRALLYSRWHGDIFFWYFCILRDKKNKQKKKPLTFSETVNHLFHLSFNFTIISQPSLCLSMQSLIHFPGLCFTFISAYLLVNFTLLLYKAASGCIACKCFHVCCMSFMLMGQKKPCSTQEVVMCEIECFHPCGKQTKRKRKKNDPGPRVLKERSHLFLLHAWKVTCTFSHVKVTADTLLHLWYKM